MAAVEPEARPARLALPPVKRRESDQLIVVISTGDDEEVTVRRAKGLPPRSRPVPAQEVILLATRFEQLVPFEPEVIEGFFSGMNLCVQKRRRAACSHKQNSLSQNGDRSI